MLPQKLTQWKTCLIVGITLGTKFWKLVGTVQQYGLLCVRIAMLILHRMLRPNRHWEAQSIETANWEKEVVTQSALEFCTIHCPNWHLGQDLGFGGFAFALKLPELLNTNVVTARAKLGQTSSFPNRPQIRCPIGQWIGCPAGVNELNQHWNFALP